MGVDRLPRLPSLRRERTVEVDAVASKEAASPEGAAAAAAAAGSRPIAGGRGGRKSELRLGEAIEVEVEEGGVVWWEGALVVALLVRRRP